MLITEMKATRSTGSFLSTSPRFRFLKKGDGEKRKDKRPGPGQYNIPSSVFKIRERTGKGGKNSIAPYGPKTVRPHVFSLPMEKRFKNGSGSFMGVRPTPSRIGPGSYDTRSTFIKRSYNVTMG